MNKRSKQIGFLISLAVHGLLAVCILFSSTRETRQSSKPTDLEIMTPEKFAEIQKKIEAANIKKLDPTMGQIVEQSDQRVNDERPEEAKYLSKFNQKILRETKAPVVDKFKNSNGAGGEKNPQPVLGQNERSADQKEELKRVKPEKNVAKSMDEKISPELTDKTLKPTAADLAKTETIEKKSAPVEIKNFVESDQGVELNRPVKMQNSLMPSFKPRPTSVNMARGGGEGPSSTDDHLKDVQTGMQTLLSTREFVYYTYYNRIKDKLRQYWEPKIKEKFETAMRAGRTIASTGDKITKVVIVLDRKGTLIRVQVVSQSGMTDLDDACVEAFRAAAPFPNPPKGIEDADGTIKIRWDFILEASAKSALDRRYAGN